MIEFVLTLWSKLRKEASPQSLTGGRESPQATSEPRHISAVGLDLVKHFESFFPVAYLCPAKVWTIGWGHTGLEHKDGTVYKGRKITLEEGERLLRRDMQNFERDVLSLVKVPIRQCEFDALVSFAFNVGSDIDIDMISEGLGDSTLLKKFNAGDKAGAAAEFLKWNRGGGKVLAGLTRRRNAERALFLGGDWQAWRS